MISCNSVFVSYKNSVLCFGAEGTYILFEARSDYSGEKCLAWNYKYPGLCFTNPEEISVKEDEGRVYAFTNDNPHQVYLWSEAMSQWTKIEIS